MGSARCQARSQSFPWAQSGVIHGRQGRKWAATEDRCRRTSSTVASQKEGMAKPRKTSTVTLGSSRELLAGREDAHGNGDDQGQHQGNYIWRTRLVGRRSRILSSTGRASADMELLKSNAADAASPRTAHRGAIQAVERLQLLARRSPARGFVLYVRRRPK